MSQFKDQISREYRKKMGLNPVFIPVGASAPASEVEL
jgi:hypothetical protein